MKRIVEEIEELFLTASPPIGSSEREAFRVFKKKRYRRIENKKNYEQLSFITSEVSIIAAPLDCVEPIQRIILEKLDGQKVSYSEIAKIVFESSMLCRRDVINKIINPLIKEKKMTRTSSVNNYQHKDVLYLVHAGKNEGDL